MKTVSHSIDGYPYLTSSIDVSPSIISVLYSGVFQAVHIFIDMIRFAVWISVVFLGKTKSMRKYQTERNINEKKIRIWSK